MLLLYTDSSALSSTYFCSFEEEDVEPTMHITGNDELLQKATERGWEGTGTKEDPIVIQGYRFHSDQHMFTMAHTDLYVNFTNNWLEGMNHSWCSIVLSLTRNVIICNNTIFGGGIGVHLLGANDSLVIRNTIYDTGYDAVFMDNGCSGNIISENYFFDNKETGVLGWTGSTRNLVSNNIIQDSDSGVAFRSSSNSNFVYNNTIERARLSGVDLETINNEVQGNLIYRTRGDGIRVFNTDNHIAKNVIFEPKYRGIYLSPDSNRTEILHNSFVDCTLESILVIQSSGHVIRFNDFLGDSENAFVVDNGEQNVFERNYWEGFVTTDDNEDGVFDLPFEIDGSAQNRDDYPLTSIINPLPAKLHAYTQTDITTTETIATSSNHTLTHIQNSMEFGSAIVLGALGIACIVIVIIFLRKRRDA